MGYEKAERLGTHSFRREAARSFLGSGGGFAQLLESGQWYSSAFRLFFDFGPGEAATAERALIETSLEISRDFPRAPNDDTGPGRPREDRIPETYSLGVLGSEIREPFGNVFGSRYPIFPQSVEGLDAV